MFKYSRKQSTIDNNHPKVEKFKRKTKWVFQNHHNITGHPPMGIPSSSKLPRLPLSSASHITARSPFFGCLRKARRNTGNTTLRRREGMQKNTLQLTSPPSFNLVQQPDNIIFHDGAPQRRVDRSRLRRRR